MGGLERVALDLVLAHEQEGEHGAGEADQARECEHVVEPSEEAGVGRVRGHLLGVCGERGQGVVEVPG